ncbi:hypothetical protein ARMSODRAFT_958614 [Armillaria solidipes]|uniref:F-box domain-containing protein n=1 Tax=Armillaria solidipes TaxID=1076256 RepID=A0A2H3BB51_9AGAR|nr:hypothetical protein ARMSODRAFT_958614 [Armillaria solidipes]
MLLSLPNEILVKISFEADNRTRRRLRRTCKLLSVIATPLVFESLYIDLSRMRLRSAPIFLKSLDSGPKLAQYIRHLSLYLPKGFPRYPSRFTSESRIKKKEEKLDLLYALFLEAIPSMVSLRLLSWSSNANSCPSYATLMFERFGKLPLLSNLNIYGFEDWDIPWSHFCRIRNIIYWGPGGNKLITFLGHNPRIESIDAHVWDSSTVGEKSISLLFSSLPPGSRSSVKTLKIHGNMYNQLYRHEVPTLIPHLRHLESLDVLVPIPDEFWDRLREDQIYLASLSYSQHMLKSSLLSYLASYTGLCELSLTMWAQSTLDDFHVACLLPSVITINSWCLTKVHIEPDYSGPWCLNHPMLDALSFCDHLESLYVCVDKAGTRVDANGNVIDRVLEASVASWPNLWDLQIYAVSRSYGFEEVRTTASQVHRHILAFRFAQLPSKRPTLRVSSVFATYSVKIHDRKRNIHAFKVCSLNYYGKKESRRKYKFWKRSNDTSDD